MQNEIFGILYPDEVQFGSTDKIKYIYDATGIKLEKKIEESGKPNMYTRYAGNFVYDRTGDSGNGSLKFFNHPEGYVDASGGNSYNGSGYKYVYQYKDHLGNIRLSYQDVSTTSTPVLEILEENNYYPFGMKHKGYNDVPTAFANIALKRKFGGKEYQDELGLNWYDVTARNYDPALGRWMNLDPLAENGRRWSPYNYAFDNPIYFIDYDGMWPWPSLSDLKQAYNQTKESVVKTYNETKKAVVETTKKVVESTKETLKEGQQWVKENKKEILNVANNMQDAGDAIAITGYVAAVAGAPVAGVGAAPGATVAAVGNGISLAGSILEIGTNLITEDYSEAGEESTFVIGGKIIDAVVDKVIPGPTPDLSKEATQALQNTKTIIEENVNLKTIIIERVYENKEDE